MAHEPALLHTEAVESSEQKSQQLGEKYIAEMSGLRKQIEQLTSPSEAFFRTVALSSLPSSSRRLSSII
jgi:hypothetical protein